MNVLFVHGFGGARGALERSLADVARGGSHHFLPVRWPSGDLREMRARAVVEVARRVAEKKSLPKGLVDAAMYGHQQASQAWQQAVANVPAGAAELGLAIEQAHATGKSIAVVAFSLGCRVLLYAIAAGVIRPGGVHRLVFAGSAAPASSFACLSAVTAATKILHVYSRRDAVLDRLYPFGDRSEKPTGREPLRIDGIENIEVDVGHRGYASIAPRLWELATVPSLDVLPSQTKAL